MTFYNPPRENVPIFDSSLFGDTDPSGTLTREEADSLYVQYPFAQGPVNFKGQTNSVIPTCSATQPATTDSSTKIPTTAWVQSVVSSIAPVGGTIGQYVVAPGLTNPQFIPTTSMVANQLYNLDIPVGTRTCVFTVIGGGGAKGTDVQVGNTMFPGGMGGSGGYGRCVIQATDDAFVGFFPFQYYFSPNANPAVGNGMVLTWSAQAQALYDLGVSGNATGRICIAAGGLAGTNATSSASGTGGNGQGVIVGGTNGFQIQSCIGGNGKSAPAGGITPYSTANTSIRGGQNANADIALNGGTLSTACDGESANYVNGATFVYGRGVGGIYIEYFT